MDNLVGRLSFRVSELTVSVETKTKDNVFVTARVTIQFEILREKVRDAFYALSDPARQITAHVHDVLRAELPNLDLDEVFEAKEELALSVKNALSEVMGTYGYLINNVLITDLDPDQRVKNAMNEINSSKRLKFAVAERAEGEKILKVKSAEAEAEAKYLSGVGIAKQRKAIVDGLKSSIVGLNEGIKGTTAKDSLDLLLLTQYFDMIKDVGVHSSCKTTFVPTSKGFSDDMRSSLLQADAAKRA